MNREQCLIEITKELQLYNSVSTHTMGNIADLLDKYRDSEIKKLSLNLCVIGRSALLPFDFLEWISISEIIFMPTDDACGGYWFGEDLPVHSQRMTTEELYEQFKTENGNSQ